MATSPRKSNSDNELNELEQFLHDIFETDGGFALIADRHLEDFHQYIVERFGYTPLANDERWEEVMNLAAKMLIGD